MAQGKTTTDHDKIKSWAEERGGVPTSVKETGSKKEAGILRLDFKPKDESLGEISWDEFFKKFESAKLAFLYQEKTASGRMSRFHKFVDRSAANEDDGTDGSKSGQKKMSAAKDKAEAKSASKTASASKEKTKSASEKKSARSKKD